MMAAPLTNAVLVDLSVAAVKGNSVPRTQVQCGNLMLALLESIK